MNAVVVGVTGVGASGALTAALTARGLRQLGVAPPSEGLPLAVAAAIGSLVGGAVLFAEDRYDNWELLPAFILWGSVVAAAGFCDASTQRIPTVLVRPGMVVASALFAIGYATVHDWRGLVLSGVASAAAATTLLCCWRFLDAGFGDVRLALLGGLGLGNASGVGVCIAFLVFVTIVAAQVTTQRVQPSDHGGRIPLGPALAAGFILAAVL